MIGMRGLFATCVLDRRTSKEGARWGLEEQAKRMVAVSSSSFPEFDVGRNVLIRVPDLGRGRAAPRNVLCVIGTESQ